MRKICLFALVLGMIVGIAPTLNAAVISGTEPKISGTAFDATINGFINSAFTSAIASANTTLAKYDKQNDLATGFANANIYSAHAGTLQGYQNYDLFAISTGVMLGAQAPSVDPSYYDKIGQELEKKGDLYAGLSAGISFVNVGINAKFIMDDLYLNFKFGKVSWKPVEELDVNNTLIGIGANYALIREHGMGWGFLKWRGLSLGTGLIYHKSEIVYDAKIDTQTQHFNTGDMGGGLYFQGDVVVDPTVAIGVTTYSYTIPVDVVTSVQLLWLLNLTLGAGVDFSYGKADIVLKSAGDVAVENTDTNIPGAYTFLPGKVSIDGSTLGERPYFIRPKIMAGLGLNISVVKIDLQVIYYTMSGAAVGLTAGIVW
ncbi:MAG: hypothetical protein EPN93_07105 [Spirochaetes bacterium]|nr:MAG: hypothetical protein EPN93_07105 [Spirochaetota bacterium]